MATAAASADPDKAAPFRSFLLKHGKYLAGFFFFFGLLVLLVSCSNANITVP